MYNFDELTDRRGTASMKWDVAENELPMWVADMDFEVAPPIKDAIIKRASHPIYGYSITPDEFFKSISGYWERRHGFKIDESWMVYSNGVVAAISSAVRKFTTPAENVLIQAPVYNIFYNSIYNNGRNILSSDLVYENGKYHIDFDDLEEKLSRPQTTLMILCNPHNPCGIVWTKEELAKIGDLCKKHGVTVFSDEIHCDFVKPGMTYTPFASVNETCAEISVTAVAGSKTFNIAGLQSACVYSKNEFLRHKIYREINTSEVGEPNAFAMNANIAAFSQCDKWVEELQNYIWQNKKYVCDYIEKNIPQLHANLSEATYLLWINVGDVMQDSVEFTKELRRLTGLYLSDGAEYGESGRPFVRMNLATQLSRVKDGCERLKNGVEQILSSKK